MSGIESHLEVHPEVAAALAAGHPVVALESTIVTHGMPYPENERMSAEVEQAIRAAGAVPAVIAVLDGRIRVGLEDAERHALAIATGARKVSTADLAWAISHGENAGTTVAATMHVAAEVGIRVFATGGIGGVHQGAEQSFDVSADLTELGRSPVIVVAAGPKAILDVPKTLEVLETNGVPVVVMGSDELPAFWSRESGIASPLRADTAEEVAEFARVREALGLPGGVLVANPVPAESEIPAADMAAHIRTAQADADSVGVRGKELTPFLLQRILELTEGRSLVTNIALVHHNAAVATSIATALAG